MAARARKEMKKKIKEKICKNCLRKFKPVRSLQVACSYTCAIKYQNKLKQLREATERARMKDLAEQIEKKPELESKLQAIVNACARALDFADPCISCRITSAKWDAGHFHSVGSNSTLRFHFDNIHKQCSQCNQHKSSNTINYEHGLLQRYGVKYLDHVKFDIVRKYPSIQLDKDRLRQAIKDARALKKLIESGYITTRKQANKFLKIYP